MKYAAFFRNSLALLAVLGLSSTVFAALEVERAVTITDEMGGTLVMMTSGTHDQLGGESTTIATFTGFQPQSEGRRIEGEVVRSRVRSGDNVETIYDGTLDISGAGAPADQGRSISLIFNSLNVVRDGEQPVLSGTVVVNGREFDAADLPPALARLLARTLRFFHFS